MKMKMNMKMTVFLFFSILTSCAHKDLKRTLSSSSSDGVVFPSNIHKTQEIFIFGNDNTSQVAIELSGILDKINATKGEGDQVKLRYFVELPLETDEGVAVIENPAKHLRDLKLRELGLSFLAKDLPESKKHAVFYLGAPDNYGWKPDLWMQDYGQFYSNNGVTTFLDLTYANLYNTSEIHRYISSPKGLKGSINTDFKVKRDAATINKTLEGGDIEALPNGTILVGSEVHPKLEEYFSETLGQKVIKVPADFVATGHVDELFSIFPVPKTADNQCGYALSFIDPMYGLRLALDRSLIKSQPRDRQKYLDAIKHFTGVEGERGIGPDMFHQLSKKFDKEKSISFKEEPWGMDPDYHQWYVFKALEIDLAIKRGLEVIKAELKSDCPNLKVTGLPVLMSDEGAGESSLYGISTDGKSASEIGDEVKKASIHLFVSPVNQLVIDEHLVIPTINGLLGTSAWNGEFVDEFIKVFKWIVPARLKKVGVAPSSIHFITSNVYVRNGGAVHCGTSSVRSSTRKVFE